MSARNEGGIVLLEVMMACVVLSGAILVVSDIFTRSLHVTGLIQHYDRAALLLEERIGIREMTGNTVLAPEEDAVLGPITWQSDSIESEDTSWHLERFRLSWKKGKHDSYLDLSTAILH